MYIHIYMYKVTIFAWIFLFKHLEPSAVYCILLFYPFINTHYISKTEACV